MRGDFHALGEFFKPHQGNYFLQTPRRGIRTCLYYTGFTLEQMPAFHAAAQEYVERMSPADYFTWYQQIKTAPQQYGVDALAAILNISHWDPQLFRQISHH